LPTKNELTQVFDDNVVNYNKFRPKYPLELIDDIIRLSGINPSGIILEIGCGTGQITLPFAQKGYRITGLEKGKSLAEYTRKNLLKYSHADVRNITFEDWKTKGEKYDIVLSAQAFHWIEVDYGLRKASQLLKSNGSICLIWNLDRSEKTHFWKLTEPIYKKYFPPIRSNRNLEFYVNLYRKKINDLDIFEDVQYNRYEWEQSYQKDEYIGLLKTFSDHMTLEESNREKFFYEIARIIIQIGNSVNRKYETVFLFSKKTD